MKKSIFITGASAGIGKTTAIMFAKKGWYVGATDVDVDGLEKLKKVIGEDHYFAELDVTQTVRVKDILATFCKKTVGKIDVLLNNAGIFEYNAFENIPVERYQALIDINVKGVFNCTYHAFPYLKNTPGSSVINLSSAAANYGVPLESMYSATKFFVRGLTEALNMEWERYGIHVCDIMPNFVKTPMTANVSGTLIDNIGVKLTSQDVADTIWNAVHKKKIHWPVDRFILKALQKLSPFMPVRMNRFILKRLAGL